jgi:hypothetical protein
MTTPTGFGWIADARRRAPILVAAVTLVVTGCGPLGMAWPTPTIYDEAGMPRWASVVVTGDPAVAGRDLDLALLTLPEAVELRTTAIPAGTVIRWEEGVSEGAFRIIGPDGACRLDVDLPPEQATAVILSVTDEGCSLRVAGPDEQPSIAASGFVSVTVAVRPWAGLVVDAVALDEPREPVPDPVPPDEGGLAIVGPLYVGRYEIRLRRGDEILETRTITIVDRGARGQLVQLELDGIQD